jgi:hypothetical protein
VKAGYIQTNQGIDLREEDFELRKKIRLQMKKDETTEAFLASTGIFSGG